MSFVQSSPIALLSRKNAINSMIAIGDRVGSNFSTQHLQSPSLISTMYPEHHNLPSVASYDQISEWMAGAAVHSTMIATNREL